MTSLRQPASCLPRREAYYLIFSLMRQRRSLRGGSSAAIDVARILGDPGGWRQSATRARERERERERERKGERERARVRESEREADLAGSDVLPLELALPHEFLFPTSLLVRQSLRLRWVA